jgi:F-type H+-transporting ATPase subunit delta
VSPESPRTEAYANALLTIARAEGHLAAVEDDLFRFARTFETSDELRKALTDRQLPVARRIAVVEELMGGKALDASVALVSMLVGTGRAADLPPMRSRSMTRSANGWRPRSATRPASRSRSR